MKKIEQYWNLVNETLNLKKTFGGFVMSIKSIDKNKAYRIAFIVIFVITASLMFARASMEKAYDKVCTIMDERVEAKELECQSRIDTIILQYEKAEEEKEIAMTSDVNAMAIARVLYGLTDYNLSTSSKNAVIDVIINRAKCTYGEFGDTIEEVCSKPQQWQGYSEDGPYLAEDYELAYTRLHSGTYERYAPDGCYWVLVEYESVTVRTNFDIHKGNSWTVE